MMKRIHAAGKMLCRLHNGKIPSRCFSDWITMYHLAGKIRDLQVLHKLLLQQPAKAHFGVEEELTARIHSFQKKFILLRSQLLNSPLVILPFLKEVNNKDLHRYINNRLKKAVVILSNNQGVLHWHEARQQLKRAIYLSDLLSKKKSSALKANLRNPLLDQLQEQLGIWHDLKVFRQFVKYEKSNIFQRSKLLLQITERMLRKERKILRLRQLLWP